MQHDDPTPKLSVDVWLGGEWFCPGCGGHNDCSARVLQGGKLTCLDCALSVLISEVKL